MRQLVAPIALLVLLEFAFVLLCLLWGPADQRRSGFSVRVALGGLAIATYMAAGLAATTVNLLPDGASSKLLPPLLLLGVAAAVCLPGRLYRTPDSPPGPSGSDDGGGPGPRSPDAPRQPPRGGIPLPDADQSRVRARDPHRPRFADVKRRRPAHAPGRTPVRTRK